MSGGPSSLQPDDPGCATLAQRDCLRSLIAELPDPEQYIFVIPLEVASALLEAWQSKDGCYRVHYKMARECSLWGLCEVQGPYLTAFGMKVRRALREEQQ